jgi:hypothetical protein
VFAVDFGTLVSCCRDSYDAAKPSVSDHPVVTVASSTAPLARVFGIGCRSQREETMLVRLWGIDSVHVTETSSGSLVKFSYRVVDAEKAKILNSKQNAPMLTVQRNRAHLEVPTTEKVGQLRQVATPENGHEYWMVFGNSGHVVQVSDLVDITIGEFRSHGLVVEPPHHTGPASSGRSNCSAQSLNPSSSFSTPWRGSWLLRLPPVTVRFCRVADKSPPSGDVALDRQERP